MTWQLSKNEISPHFFGPFHGIYQSTLLTSTKKHRKKDKKYDQLPKEPTKNGHLTFLPRDLTRSTSCFPVVKPLRRRLRCSEARGTRNHQARNKHLKWHEGMSLRSEWPREVTHAVYICIHKDIYIYICVYISIYTHTVYCVHGV